MGKIKDKTKPIGERIREARESQGISQTELAAKIKITQPSLSQIESGVTMPSFLTLDSICRFLELTISLAPKSRKKPSSRRNS